MEQNFNIKDGEYLFPDKPSKVGYLDFGRELACVPLPDSFNKNDEDGICYCPLRIYTKTNYDFGIQIFGIKNYCAFTKLPCNPDNCKLEGLEE